MNKLYVMIGCPGSGKSTFAKNIMLKGKEDKIKYISRDEIRFSIINENEAYFSKEDEVYRKFIGRIKDALKEGYDVIADATHLNSMSRYKLFSNLGNSIKNIEVIAVFMRTPLDICIKQNENRKGTRAYLPPEQIRKMFGKLKFPTLFEYNGCFNFIYHVFPNGRIEIERRK